MLSGLGMSVGIFAQEYMSRQKKGNGDMSLRVEETLYLSDSGFDPLAGPVTPLLSGFPNRLASTGLA